MADVDKQKKAYGFMTLDQIVRGAIADLGAGLERYEQFLKWGKDCYRMFKMDMAREIKTVELPIKAWKAIEWPEDYVMWTAIGIRKNGRVYVFSNDSELPLYFDTDDEGEPEANVEPDFIDDENIDITSDRIYIFRNFNSFGEDQGRIFGLKAKSNGIGYFRVNRERREIQLNPVMADSGVAYMEYVASSHNPCSQTIVPEYAVQMHEDFIHWKRLKFAKSSSMGEVRDAKDDFYAEARRVAQRIDDTTIADIVEAAVDGYVGIPHF